MKQNDGVSMIPGRQDHVGFRDARSHAGLGRSDQIFQDAWFNARPSL